MVVSRTGNSAVFLASGLPELPGDKTYQLWFDDGGTRHHAPGRTCPARRCDGDAGSGWTTPGAWA
ncbi:anti-sigma factor [Streptomyces sp. NPDC093595]|uniref:anti-sigma factor n=1 Tax=Streptomyces sp. NPDC093595 TaxID=3366045 RepID=UPI00381AC618